VWALGMLVYEMIRGATPFALMSDVSAILAHIDELGVPELKKKRLSVAGRNFVKQCTILGIVSLSLSLSLFEYVCCC
jgi:serine/threonine protein kinase